MREGREMEEGLEERKKDAGRRRMKEGRIRKMTGEKTWNDQLTRSRKKRNEGNEGRGSCKHT